MNSIKGLIAICAMTLSLGFVGCSSDSAGTNLGGTIDGNYDSTTETDNWRTGEYFNRNGDGYYGSDGYYGNYGNYNNDEAMENGNGYKNYGNYGDNGFGTGAYDSTMNSWEANNYYDNYNATTTGDF